jgi:hypothetical protein
VDNFGPSSFLDLRARAAGLAAGTTLDTDPMLRALMTDGLGDEALDAAALADAEVVGGAAALADAEEEEADADAACVMALATASRNY